MTTKTQSNNSKVIDKISSYSIMYENLGYNISAKKSPTHLVCHKLYGVYNLIKHFNIACKDIIVDKNIKSSEDFTRKYLGNESTFWKQLYQHDINNIINHNDSKLMLSYIKDDDGIKYKTHDRNIFGSCYCPVGSLVYNFKYNDPSNRFIINIYPVTTTIIVKDPTNNSTHLMLKNKNNYLYWSKIKDNAEVANHDDYQLLQEIIYCITDGYQASSIPSMTFDYFKNHFHNDEYDYIEEYYKNSNNVCIGYNFDDRNILIKCLDPYILEDIIVKTNITDNNRKAIFDKYFTVLINSIIAKCIDSYEREYEHTYITKIQLPKCIAIIKKYFSKEMESMTEKERNDIKQCLEKYPCDEIDIYSDVVYNQFS